MLSSLDSGRPNRPIKVRAKTKQIYEKEGQDTHITGITFECQQVNFLIYPNLIRQPAVIVKTKIEVFVTNIDWRTINATINKN